MSQHKDHFTPRMFHRLLAPSLAYSLGLAFAAMADAIVIGWQMGVTGLAALCFSLPLHTMLLAFVHGLGPVSYTHLDVYKRQGPAHRGQKILQPTPCTQQWNLRDSSNAPSHW